ncbi:hypothetical protein LG311_11880 [Sutcliffiella horikoshii]|nr:hypothetical protein [Sutcliffiella horikoshii]UAL45636.1 hypothetical protein K7887_11795 [Sutcliffiella horikoshii]
MQEYHNSDSFKLAYDIIKLDCRRDQIWEELLKKEGNRALEILRLVQNSK